MQLGGGTCLRFTASPLNPAIVGKPVRRAAETVPFYLFAASAALIGMAAYCETLTTEIARRCWHPPFPFPPLFILKSAAPNRRGESGPAQSCGWWEEQPQSRISLYFRRLQPAGTNGQNDFPPQ